MKVFIKEITWLTRKGIIDFGWGNGYVLIPEDHPLHGKDYDDIFVDVHGGLTFSELVDSKMVNEWGLDKDDEGKWCVGFDTLHTGDNIDRWPKYKVQQEAELLRDKLLKYYCIKTT